MLPLALFLSCAASDFLCVRFYLHVQRGNATRAALYSGFVTALAIFSAWWSVRAAENAFWVILGHSFGSWLAVRYTDRNLPA